MGRVKIMKNTMRFLANDKKTVVELTDKLFVSDINDNDSMIAVELPEGRSMREKLMNISEEYLTNEVALSVEMNEDILSVVESIMSCKQEMLYRELAHQIAPVFERTIRSGNDLGNNVFIYKGVVVEGGENTHLHNLMHGLQNLLGYVDATGMWSHKSMMKYIEKDSSIPYWQRYATRAFIAYAKSVPSLYVHGINELTVEELRVIYETLRIVAYKEDMRKKRIRAIEAAEKKREDITHD